MSFKKTELTHSATHYLSAIHKLQEEHGYARMVDIAKLLKFSRGSVSIAIKNLKKKNLITENKNGFLILSKNSHKKVHEVLANKTLLYYFLTHFLGVNKKTAESDSCLMEHILSTESQKKLFIYIKKINKDQPSLKNSKNLAPSPVEGYNNLNSFKESLKS